MPPGYTVTFSYATISIILNLQIYIINVNKEMGNTYPEYISLNNYRKWPNAVQGLEIIMIINMTPHEINIIAATDVSFDASISKFVAPVGTTPVVTIQSSGVLNAKADNIIVGRTSEGAPIFMTLGFSEIDPIPDFIGPDDLVIVSNLYARAYDWKADFGDERKFMVVTDPVMTPDGKTLIGVTGIKKAL